jgi:CMP-N,N'-diacetyllegionaminic acid synthase
MNILGIIPARGGSKEVPRKNLLKLGKKTLLEHAIDSARESNLLTRTIVSTEDEEIFENARKAGADLPFRRPVELAQDDSSNFSVMQYAVDWLSREEVWETDIVVLLQPTTPFRTGEHIDGVIDLLVKTGADAAITIKHPQYPPHWMLTLGDDCMVSCLLEGGNQFLRRQDAPLVFQPAGSVYALKKELLFSIDRSILPVGDTRGYPISEEEAINIDSALDFRLAQLIWEKKGL